MPDPTTLVSPGPDLPRDEDAYDPGVPMPAIFALRVRTPRGLGIVLRVRDKRKSPFLIKIDGADKPYWALAHSVQPIGFSKSTKDLKI